MLNWGSINVSQHVKALQSTAGGVDVGAARQQGVGGDPRLKNASKPQPAPRLKGREDMCSWLSEGTQVEVGPRRAVEHAT